MAGQCYAIILAAGSGSRINNLSCKPKQFQTVLGRSILEHAVDKFEQSKYVDQIIIVARPEYMDYTAEIVKLNRFIKVSNIVQGGRTRRESSLNAIKMIKENDALVLVHDAVRPFVTEKLIERCVTALNDHETVYPAVPSEDTVVESDGHEIVRNIPLRSRIFRGQTPQGFRKYILEKAHSRALEDPEVDDMVTNECGLVWKYNLAEVHLIEGERYNFKITYDEDLFFAESYLKSVKE